MSILKNGDMFYINIKAKPAPALTREPQAAPDSSDEEEDRLLQLGAEGK